MARITREAFSGKALKRAWDEVLANDIADGNLSPGVKRLQEDLDENLATLAGELADGTYEPRQLTPITIAGKNKSRELHIPHARDRVVARAILHAATPAVDPHLGSGAFAYRPGLGVADAVQAVVALRGEGLGWVLRTDVRDCFPTLPKEVALRRFGVLVEDEHVAHIVGQLLNRTYRASSGGIRTLTGVPQGCPLSPLLANLVLVDLDRRLQRRGFPVVRYADDLVVAAHSETDIREAARIAAAVTEELGMSLNAEKTTVATFDEGFAFLGEDFGPRYPPQLDNHRMEEPQQRVLYVALQGSRVRTADGRVVVESKDNTSVLNVPSSQVGRIVCFGSVGISAGVRTWLLSNDIGVVFASRKGNYLGTMVNPAHGTRPARLRGQLAVTGTLQALNIARAIVLAKITKQQVLLERMNRRPNHEQVSDAVGQLDALIAMLPAATSPMEVMGLEGAAARFYFPCLGTLVPEDLRFEMRSRQPPQDIFNAAISYLYTILLSECVTALHAAGLDPALGILHTEQNNRPSLALDLMEEFRPWIVDQVVTEAAVRKQLRAEHGRREEGRGVVLTKEGKRVIVDAYERRMLGQVRGSLADFSGSRRRHVYRQAQRLRSAIMSADNEWTGLSWRP